MPMWIRVQNDAVVNGMAACAEIVFCEAMLGVRHDFRPGGGWEQGRLGGYKQSVCLDKNKQVTS